MAAQPAGEPLSLRVIEVAFDGGWKTAEEIDFSRDGSYRRVIRNFAPTGGAPKVMEGHVPASVARTLADQAKGSGFEVVNGVPTYRFGVDDNFVRHPAIIRELLRSISDANEAAHAAVEPKSK